MRPTKFENLTFLKTQAVRGKHSFSTVRLLKEVQQLEQEKIPFSNVAILPSTNNVYKWLGLLQGPKDSIYEGLYIRFELNLPMNYPQQPPSSINIVGGTVEIPHPLIFRSTICLEVFQKGKDASSGWNSLYTIKSIVQQLQGFLWEGHNQWKDQSKKIKLIKAAIKANESFKFADKKAGWPGAVAETELQIEEFKQQETEVELYRNSLKCFHSQMGIEDGPLGFGLKVTRISRTGVVKQCSAAPNLLSLKSFIKHGIRRSIANDTFGYWFPAYFGADSQERTLHLAKKSLSFIMTNRTDKFQVDQVGKVLLKAMFTVILRIVDEKLVPCTDFVRQIVYFHSLMLLFIKVYPQIVEEIDLEIEKFLKDKTNRTKDSLDNLGLILVYTLFSEKYTFSDVSQAYFEEQLDRQVFWILLKIPELDDTKNYGNVILDDNRVEITFMSQIISYLLVIFFHDYRKIVRSNFKSWSGMLEFLESHGSKLETKVEDEILKTFNEAKTNVKSYSSYFQRIGLPDKNQQELNNMLKQAVKNSREKRYHGDVDHVIGLPSEDKQIQEYLSKQPDLTEHIVDGKLKEYSEEEWKEHCFNRWQWMKHYFNSDYTRSTTPAQLAQEQERRDTQDYIVPCYADQVNETLIKDTVKIKTGSEEFYSERGVQNYEKNFTWEQLYLKLDLENSVVNLNYHQDFKMLYHKLDLVSDKIKTFTLYITPSNKLKSGYFYVCAVLSKLAQVKVLKIKTKYMDTNQTISYKAINNLKKGFFKLAESSKELTKIRISNCKFLNQAIVSDAVLEIFSSISNLSSIELENTDILNLKEIKIANAIIVNHPDIKELIIRGGCDNDTAAKSIADGLMRAKKLELLIFTGNNCPGGITSLLYNLAFSPKLTILELNQSYISNMNEFVENLTKLVSISGAIEYLNISGITCFANFKQEFFKALGENISLKYLDFSNTGTGYTQVQWLAHSLAINAENKGSIRELITENTINQSNYSIFITSLWTNPHLYETWYGDLHKAEKMGGTDREKKFICNLTTLTLNGCAIQCAEFNYEKYIKEIASGMPEWVKLFITCNKLKKLGLQNCGLTTKHFETLRAALEKGLLPKHVQGNQGTNLTVEHIEVFNIGNN